MTTTQTVIQVRRDTSSNWSTTNPIPKQGEFCYETDTGKLKIGDGATYYNSLGYIALDADKQDNLTFGEGLTESSGTVKALPALQKTDCVYQGVDLSTKFASEITASYSGNVWAWIKARIQAGNYEGIHIGDYIPFQLSAGNIGSDYSVTAKNMNAQIVGIDTYIGYGNEAVGHHIDFITKEVIGVAIPYNATNNNNGTSDYPCPFLASKIYACLNGIDNTSTGYGDVAHGYNASSGGVKQLLPSALQSVIIGKKIYAPTRYSSAGLLTVSNSLNWETWGGLWLPTETEVYGYPIHTAQGIDETSGVNYDLVNAMVQYPIFQGVGNGPTRIKSRTPWWLASVSNGSSSLACTAHGYGPTYAYNCSKTDVSVPVCFRIG